MKVIEKLAVSLGRRDEAPNVELANAIVVANDKKAVKELVENLFSKNKDIQSDCIKVLYEIGALQPKLIAGYVDAFLTLLDSKNNRLQWGAMTALNAITHEKVKIIYQALAKILTAADKGSVITKDHCMGILVKLSATKEYGKDTYSLLMERLMTAAANQLPMYAEKAMPVVNKNNQAAFVKVLQSRMANLEKESQRERLEKIIKKFSGK